MTNEGNGPALALARLGDSLRALGVSEFAVSGGVAVGVWAAPRTTRDIDVCGVVPQDAVNRVLAQLDGIRWGPSELPDSIRFTIDRWDVDLFVAKSAYDRECLARAVEVEVFGTKLQGVTAEDLLVHKLVKLRTDRRRILQDLADMGAVITTRGAELDRAYLQRVLSAADAELLDALVTLDDEALVQRVMKR